MRQKGREKKNKKEKDKIHSNDKFMSFHLNKNKGSMSSKSY